jgi:hypothetical protein
MPVTTIVVIRLFGSLYSWFRSVFGTRTPVLPPGGCCAIGLVGSQAELENEG